MNKYLLSILAFLFTMLFSYAQTGIPTTGLVAYYPFSGNAGDSSGNGNHGTLGSGGNAPTITTDRAGNLNRAYYFDGVSDIITIPTNTALKPNTLTISAWIKPESKSGTSWNFIMTCRYSYTNAPYDSYKLATHPNSPYSNKWTFGLGNQSTMTQKELTSKNNKQDNQWSHITGTYDGATMKLYTNGVLDTAINFIIPNIAYSTATLNIGNSLPGALDAFLGTIDEVRIYNRALSAGEVRALAGLSPVYYSKSTGSLNQLSTWGTETDGTGTAPLNFNSNNVTYNVVNGNTSLTGDFVIGGANSTLVFGNGTGTVTFPIAAGDTVYADSVYVNNLAAVTVSGALHSNKLGSGTGSFVQYISSTSQQLAKGTYENLIVSSSTKQMNGNITVRGILGMLASINTNGNELTLGVSTSVRGTLNRSSGTIIGKFTRWFTNATNTGTTGLFPIGSTFLYNPYTIEYTSAPTTGGKISCEFIAGLPGEAGLPQFDFSSGFVFIDKIAIEGLVRVTNTGVSGGTQTVTFTANNYTGVNNYANLRLMYRTIGSNWSVSGTAGTNTGSNASASVVRTGLSTSTGEFAIGGDKSENPLPVKMLSFTANQKTEETVELNWKTAYELNADKFIVERSYDFNTWGIINQTAARGFASSTTSYQYNDNTNGITGPIYYRLIEQDKNGAKTICGTASVDIKLNPVYELTIYPNPAKDIITVKGLTGSATIYNLLGVPMGEVHKDGKFSIIDFPQGVYFFRTSTHTLRFIKN